MFGDFAKFETFDQIRNGAEQQSRGSIVRGPTVRALSQLRVAGLLAALVSLSACARPSEEECEASAKKMASFFAGTETAEPTEANKAARELASGMVEEMKADCLKQGTKREVECIMAAKTLEDMEVCAK